VPVDELLAGLFVAYDDRVATIFDLRFPRIFIALVAGASLAVSGVLLQAAVRNPLADPGIIGVNAGASFAAILVTAFAPSLFFFMPIAACAGGLLAFALVYALSWKGGALAPVRIILTGIAVSALFAGLSSAFSTGSGGVLTGVASLVDANISAKTWRDFFTLAGYALAGLVPALFVARRCDLLSLSGETAASLGVDVTKTAWWFPLLPFCWHRLPRLSWGRSAFWVWWSRIVRAFWWGRDTGCLFRIPWCSARFVCCWPTPWDEPLPHRTRLAPLSSCR